MIRTGYRRTTPSASSSPSSSTATAGNGLPCIRSRKELGQVGRLAHRASSHRIGQKRRRRLDDAATFGVGAHAGDGRGRMAGAVNPQLQIRRSPQNGLNSSVSTSGSASRSRCRGLRKVIHNDVAVERIKLVGYLRHSPVQTPGALPLLRGSYALAFQRGFQRVPARMAHLMRVG